MSAVLSISYVVHKPYATIVLLACPINSSAARILKWRSSASSHAGDVLPQQLRGCQQDRILLMVSVYFKEAMRSNGFRLPTIRFDFCGPFVCDMCTCTLSVRLWRWKEKRARTLWRHTSSTNPMTNQSNACWAFTRLAQDLGRSN